MRKPAVKPSALITRLIGIALMCLMLGSTVSPLQSTHNVEVRAATETVINVPFKAQVPPGNWSDTKNCGQASALLVFCYYNGRIPTEQGIKDIDDWLYQKYGDPVNNYNGSETNTTKLEALAQEYAGFLDGFKASGWDIERVKQEIDAGHPVVVAVVASYLPNRGYDWAGGHFLVAKGYDDGHVICNDPGTSEGNSKYYINSDFSDAMSAQGGAVVVVMPSGAANQHDSLDYFKITQGHGIKYHVTDDYHALDCNVWAVSQYFETSKPHELDFVFTLIKEGTEGGYFRNSSMGGEVSRGTEGKDLTLFYRGYPIGNQANFYFNFSLPRYFNSGDEWSVGGREYNVEYVGSQTVSGIEFSDCIKVTIDDSLNNVEYLRGTGYFILARDVGIVELVFNRMSGESVMFEYVEHDQLGRHTISGTVSDGGVPVEAIIVQISNANWGTRSVTDSTGAFSIQAYGSDIVLRIGYDKGNDDILDFDDPNYPWEYCVNNITSDISGLVIDAHPPYYVRAHSAHFTSGYYVELMVDDPNQTIQSVSVTGPGIDGSLPLVSGIRPNQWWSRPNVNLGTTPPSLPLVYTFTITDKTGATYMETDAVLSYVEGIATNLSPANNEIVTGELVFSWTGIDMPQVRYNIELYDGERRRIWESPLTTNTSYVFDGPTLSPGVYQYFVCSWSEYGDESLAYETFRMGEPYAIIVAGQGGWPEKYGIIHMANNAYRVLRNLGLDDDHICYLNSVCPQDIDGNGDDEVDAPALIDDFYDAMIKVTNSIAVTPGPFILYLVGHGTRGEDDPDLYFFEFVEGGQNEEGPLTASALNFLLSLLPEQTPMLVVVNCCYSGGFITSSKGNISAVNRIIITSAHDDLLFGNPIWLDAVCFSDRFWGNLNKGLDVREAFTENATASDVTYRWLDDNGDSRGHQPYFLGDDGEFAAKTRIGVSDTGDLELTPWYYAWKHSPGELRVYDWHGRVTGLVNGEIKEEIPASVYDEENEIVAIFSSLGTYRYEVIGTSAETYSLDIGFIDGAEATTFAATNIPTTFVVTHRYAVDWDDLSQGYEGVTVEIDSDGDGVFEKTITADTELTHHEFMLQTATTLDFDPDTLSLTSKGQFVTVYIELPSGYDVNEINVSSIRLNTSVPALAKPAQVGDHDSDGIPDLMVKFERTAVQEKLTTGDQVEITISGEVAGIVFEGSDTIRVIHE